MAKKADGALDRAARAGLEQMAQEGLPGAEGWTGEALGRLLKAVALRAYLTGHEDAKLQRALYLPDRSQPV